MLRSAFALTFAVAIVATETAALFIFRAVKPVVAFFVPAMKTGAVEAVEIVDGEEIYWGVEFTPTDEDALFPEDDDDEIVEAAAATATRPAIPPMTRGIAASVAAVERQIELAAAERQRAAARTRTVAALQAAAMAYLLRAQQEFRDGNINAALLAEPTAAFGSPSNPQRMTVQEGRLLYATAGLPVPANLNHTTIFFVESIFVRPNPVLEWYLEVVDPIDQPTQPAVQCGCGGCPRTASGVRMCAFLTRLRVRQAAVAHCARRSALRGKRSLFGRHI